MNEKEKNFIVDWNKNAHLISKDFFGKSNLDLIEDCLKVHNEIVISDFLLKLIVLKEIDIVSIRKYIDLIKALEHIYHRENFINPKKDRKYKYVGEKGAVYDVKIKRKLNISEDAISIASVSQKAIDIAIVDEFCDGRNKYDGSDYRFIYYQAKINDFSSVRLKSWKQIYSKKVGTDYNFFSEMVVFFKKYETLELDIDKLELLIRAYYKFKGFSYFEEYLEIDSSDYIDESIDIFKTLHFNEILNDYGAKEKISIDTELFRKNEIKRISGLLKTKPDYMSYARYFDKPSIYESYMHLVNGNRKFFDNLSKKDRAGEVEAIVDFLDYLKGQDIIKKKQTASKNFRDKENRDLLPLEVFDNTRNYLKKNAVQVNTCYRYKAYDACAVLLRKITEILIIEIYENEDIEYKIKDPDGNYLMLKGLINCFINEKKFGNLLSRNMKEILPKIKKNGDLSAHNRKYNSRKPDIDKLADDCRVLFEEMINSIYH